jgi:hypothetical protein
MKDDIYLLLAAYTSGRNYDAVDTPVGKLEDFLRTEGADTCFPYLYTYESYYSALVRKVIEKLEINR